MAEVARHLEDVDFPAVPPVVPGQVQLGSGQFHRAAVDSRDANEANIGALKGGNHVLPAGGGGIEIDDVGQHEVRANDAWGGCERPSTCASLQQIVVLRML